MNGFTSSMAAKNPLRVLLLDDDEFLLEFVGDLLRELGAAEVLTATDGKQGLAILAAQDPKPGMLLCDLSMPGMDGIEFLRHVAKLGYSGGIALLSGMDAGVLKAAELLAQTHGLNLLGALRKPVVRTELAAAIARIGQLNQLSGGYGSIELLTPEEIREGFSADRLEVFFQPKVSVRERNVLGAECLARWRHPERGILLPVAFISVAEQNGLIDELTLAVLSKAVAQQGVWQRQGHDLKIAVNVSMDNLHRLDLPEIFEGIARNAGVAARNIVLEITESCLMDNLALSLDILTRLRLKGFGLSIDDFGTGYSTLEKLKQLPFNELKVDRAFVNGAHRDAAARAILESSVHLGKALNLNLVAEGVETQQDWDMIAEVGCDEVQGFFVAKPMPSSELIGWKKHWEAL